MQYKTIVLELLQQSPIHDQLKKKRQLLATLNLLAGQLKANHKAWKEQLSQERPGSHPSQIASEALEIALKELEERLPSESPQDQSDTPSLEVAMTYLRRHTPPE